MSVQASLAGFLALAKACSWVCYQQQGRRAAGSVTPDWLVSHGLGSSWLAVLGWGRQPRHPARCQESSVAVAAAGFHKNGVVYVPGPCCRSSQAAQELLWLGKDQRLVAFTAVRWYGKQAVFCRCVCIVFYLCVYVYGCFGCLYVCVLCANSTLGAQKRALDPQNWSDK